MKRFLAGMVLAGAGTLLMDQGVWTAQAGVVSPPPPPPPPGAATSRPRDRDRTRLTVEHLTADLALTEDQVNKVKDLDKARQDRVRAAGEDQAKRREAGLWFQAEVRKILTPEQLPKFEGMLRSLSDREIGLTDRLKDELNLTPDQVAKIEALRPGLDQKLKDAGNDATIRTAVWTEFQTSVRNLLTDEQKAKYDARAAELRERLNNMGLVRVDRALFDLNLTPEQRKQIDSLRADRERKVQEAFKAFQDGVKAVLTPEQAQKFEAALRQPPPSPGRGGPGRSPRRGDGPPPPGAP